MRAAAVLVAALAVVAAAGAAGVDTSSFRYVRDLPATVRGTVAFRADGPLFAHAKAGFADVRVLDARGEPVPWRQPPTTDERPVRAHVLDRGTTAAGAVALLDLGPRRVVRDRIELTLPQRRFLGRATVFGGDTRGGRFARLGTTPVYDVAGAAGAARSTVAVFPPSDFRWYRVEVTHVAAILGAAATSEPRERRPEPIRAVSRRSETGRTSRLVLDLRYAKTPVDELRVTARTPRYDREVTVESADRRGAWRRVASGRIVHFPGTLVASLPAATRGRFVRVTVENGDDAPLAGLAAVALARPRVLLAEGGHPRPYRVLYGSPGAAAPRYDFARLPATALPRQRQETLGPERANAAFEPPRDTRSFLERNGWVVQAALVLVALAVAGVGVLVLRRRT